MSHWNKHQKTHDDRTADEVRDQNSYAPTIPTSNWDGTNKGKTPLLGDDRDPKKVA